MRRLLTSLVVAGVMAAPATAQGHFYSGCKKNKCKRHVVRPFDSKLDRMAQCESTGRWFINSLFDGGLQFSPATWTSTGSTYSYAYLAPILEQKYRAVILRFRIGTWTTTAGWPRCGFA